MDEYLTEDRNWDKVLGELRYLSRYELESGLGYKDVKDAGNREFLRGMAWLYNALEGYEAGIDTEVEETLERIRAQVQQETLSEVREWIYGTMNEMLTAMLDEEAEE